MPTFTASWVANQTLHTAAALNAGASVSADIDLANLGLYAVTISVDVQFPSGSDANDAEISVYGSQDSGSNIDTESMQRISVPFVASTTKRKPVIIAGVPWARVTVKNNTALNFTSVSSKYRGLKQASA